MRFHLLSLVLLASGCSSAPPLVSAGSSEASPVTVDGDAADWGASLLAVAGKPLTVGLRSDAEAVMVAVVTSDRAVVRQILQTGLSVWLDAEGGTGRDFGVTVPVRETEGAPPPPSPRETDADRAARFAAAPLRVAVTSGGETAVYGAEAVPDLRLAAGFDGATFVVELRVPFAADGPFALGAAPGDLIGVGVETTPPSRDDLRDRLDERASRGGAGSASGSPQRRADRGVPAEALRERPDPVELWLRVALAGG